MLALRDADAAHPPAPAAPVSLAALQRRSRRRAAARAAVAATLGVVAWALWSPHGDAPRPRTAGAAATAWAAGQLAAVVADLQSAARLPFPTPIDELAELRRRTRTALAAQLVAARGATGTSNQAPR